MQVNGSVVKRRGWALREMKHEFMPTDIVNIVKKALRAGETVDIPTEGSLC